LEAFKDASKTRADLDAFLGEYGNVLQGGQGCILNEKGNRCRKTKKGEVDDGKCVWNTGTGRCNKKKAAPKKKKTAPKKKRAAPKKKKAAPKKKKAAPKKKTAPKKKKTGRKADGRLSARHYVDEMNGQAGDKVDI
jgi:hypothetical protein